jgi:hypothetical protein
MDGIDLTLRDIDSDLYLDTAFGIITARSREELDQYVERLLHYVPVPRLKIYSATPTYQYINLSSEHVVHSTVMPRETLIEESLLQGVPIGLALKDLKNRYIMVTESSM